MSTRYLALSLTMLAACVDPPAPSERTRCDYRGGAFISFGVQGESFRVWATDPAFIKSAERQIPVLAISGTADCSNPPELGPRDWHAVPTPMSFADVTIEVCDAVPSYVDSHVSDFVRVGFCPWSARVIAVARQ
jgi:hypothetical protein